MIEILFLVPPCGYDKKHMPVDRIYGCNYGYDCKPPIHLLQLATIVEQLGCEARFLDCPAEGYTVSSFINSIKRSTSLTVVVFFSVWLSAEGDLKAAQAIFEILPGVTILFAGPYPTWRPEIFLKGDNYFVIRGEPEDTLREILRSFYDSRNHKKAIKGLSFLEDGNLISTGTRELIDIDTLAIPDRRFLRGDYFFNRIDIYPATALCVSRGCSYRCTYCAPNALDQTIELEYIRSGKEKPPLRVKHAENVVKEFKEIASLGYRGVEICDNQFVWDKQRVMQICNAIRPLKLQWICYARADHLRDRDMLLFMREAGCQLIYIGTESFNQRILDDIGKGLKVRDNYQAVDLVRACGIEPEISVLLGASGLETKDSIADTIREARKMKTSFIHFSIASPLPNTILYKTAKEKGWIQGGEFRPLDNVRGAMLDLPNVQARTLQKIIKRYYMKQYFSFHFIFLQIKPIFSFVRLKYRLKGLSRFVKYLCSNT